MFPKKLFSDTPSVFRSPRNMNSSICSCTDSTLTSSAFFPYRFFTLFFFCRPDLQSYSVLYKHPFYLYCRIGVRQSERTPPVPVRDILFAPNTLNYACTHIPVLHNLKSHISHTRIPEGSFCYFINRPFCIFIGKRKYLSVFSYITVFI